MATFSNASEAFYDDVSGTSPRAFRNPQMNRPIGRNDGYGSMHNPMYGAEGSLPTMRFDNMRDGFNGQMQNPAAGNIHFPYDAGAAQTWSSSGGSLQSFGSGLNGMPQNPNFGPSRSVKPSRGRAGISNVSSPSPPSRETHALTSSALVRSTPTIPTATTPASCSTSSTIRPTRSQ